MNGDRRMTWLREAQRKIAPKDISLLVLGGIVGFIGNALFSGDLPTSVLLIVVVTLGLVSVVSIDRFRFDADQSLRGTHEEARDHLLDLKRQIDDHHLELREELDTHLNYVHAAVAFVEDSAGRNGDRARDGRPGYDTAARAVRRATERIWVIGDYSPPAEEGAGLDPERPPARRSEYLSAIESMLIDRLNLGDPSLPRLTYRRYIQRPLDIFNEVRQREHASFQPGVWLRREDMVGDEQAFEHCARVLQVKATAARMQSDRVSIDIRLIPFLPNCPSVLLIDDDELQFTIPTRTDQPGSDFAALGLLGVLVMQDHANGTQICKPFSGLFDRLRNVSVFVKGTENERLASRTDGNSSGGLLSAPRTGNDFQGNPSGVMPRDDEGARVEKHE